MPTEDADRRDILDLTEPISRVVRARVHDPEVAQDVVQETLARVLRWARNRQHIGVQARRFARTSRFSIPVHVRDI
jgi:DNA-directed RNA polymerase specialized sigma24 family protein